MPDQPITQPDPKTAAAVFDPPTPEPTPDAADGPQSDGTPEPDHQDPEVVKARREAAALRRRLREAEAARDWSTSALEAMRTNEATRIASTMLVDGRDLFALGGVTIADVLDDDGLVDPGKIKAATDALLADRPHLATRPAPASRRPVESLQTGSGAGLTTPQPEGVSWAQVLGGRS